MMLDYILNMELKYTQICYKQIEKKHLALGSTQWLFKMVFSLICLCVYNTKFFTKLI